MSACPSCPAGAVQLGEDVADASARAAGTSVTTSLGITFSIRSARVKNRRVATDARRAEFARRTPPFGGGTGAGQPGQ